MRIIIPLLIAVICSAAVAQTLPTASDLKFSFSTTAPPPGFIAVPPTAIYSKDIGYGFEPGASVHETTFATSDKPFYFSIALPEGNHTIKLTLGDPQGQSTTTVKAELRRLMLENIHTETGQQIQRTIIVNTRTTTIPGQRSVSLKPREKTTEAWAWDDKLTLEFNGSRPAIASIEISPADVPTVFILGDSTVCDQPTEPFASWGQMLPRFFKPEIAIANNAESGETVASSTNAGRLRKVLSVMKPGDYLLMQFGHNDMKSTAPNADQNYKAALISWVKQTREKGAPILITPMNRHTFNGDTVTNSLRDYPDMVRQAAKEQNVPLIDLNMMSKALYESFGPKPSIQLFEHNPDMTKFDATHHSPFGAYELAKCIVQGIEQNKLDLAKYIVDDWQPFDPAHPDSPQKFTVPPSPNFSTTKPLGN
jgi:lysophospholipase L1-like esterase